MSQSKRIAAHLKKGPITPLQALRLYGCYRLAARINDLRNSGMRIDTQLIEQEGARFAKYRLLKESPR